MRCHTRKPTICIYVNKDADQLCSGCTADQRLCFCSIMMPLLTKSQISSFLLFSVAIQPGLCRSWSETQIVCFLTQRSIYLSEFLEVLHDFSLPSHEAIRTVCCISSFSWWFPSNKAFKLHLHTVRWLVSFYLKLTVGSYLILRT